MQVAITETGEVRCGEHPQSFRDVILLREGPEHTVVWKHLRAIVRDGRHNGFVREYGATAFEYSEHEATYRKAFDGGMSSHSRLQTHGQSRHYRLSTWRSRRPDRANA